MQRPLRHLAACALIAALAPLPVLAGDSLVLGAGADAQRAIRAAAGGALRLIYLESPPEAVAMQPAPAVTGQPPKRPVIVLAASCGWDKLDQGLGQVRASFAASPLWLLEPGAGACDTDALRAAFDAAAEAPEQERLAMLLASGLRLSSVEAPAPAETAPSGAGGGFGGSLVITALPAGASFGEPLVIRAISPEEVTPPATGTAPGPQPAVQASPGRGGAEPAVVVGELASLLAAEKRSPRGVPREVRDRIREIDPDFFVTLLEIGSFDPENREYEAAIQTELAAMNCYTDEIDNRWGAGSRSAVSRYYETRGSGQGSITPGPALFHEIVTAPGVTCPAPVLRVRTEPGATASRLNNNNSGRSVARRSGNSGAGATQARNTQPVIQPTTPARETPQLQPATNLIDPALAAGTGGTGIIK
ncbi:MAG: hypothetical protein Q4G26_10600 [Paracoccus sp. (in: a-proteobacteria)]|nr:hypothetical protein [Paracoccus sp. (in: a-proteobacteria)]